MMNMAGLVKLGTNLWVRPGNIISVAPQGGEYGSTEPGCYYINIAMPGDSDSGYTCNQVSDWPMAKVLEALSNFWNIPEIEEIK